MTLRLTPTILESAYELLRATPPFNKWSLPDADGVEFHVVVFDNAYGDHLAQSNGIPRIRICNKKCNRLADLVLTMAHEMTHLYQRRTDGHRESAPHGPKFQRLAKNVCRAHGYDFKNF
jgi:hypothetical protein